MPKGAKFIHPKRVHVIVGPPILPPPSVAGGRVPRGAVRQITAELHATLQQLYDDASKQI
jgi:hypothetical protein